MTDISTPLALWTVSPLIYTVSTLSTRTGLWRTDMGWSDWLAVYIPQRSPSGVTRHIAIVTCYSNQCYARTYRITYIHAYMCSIIHTYHWTQVTYTGTHTRASIHVHIIKLICVHFNILLYYSDLALANHLKGVWYCILLIMRISTLLWYCI